jgi:DNA-binding beta-propeller fold protein YncE
MLALVGLADSRGDYISVIDIPARQTEATTLKVGPGPHDIAITSDDALALVVSADRTLRVVDIGARTVEAQPIPTGGQVCDWTLATTPDPRWAFVGVRGTWELRMIDVVARTSAPFEPLPGAHTFACAFSPTGSALVVQSDWRGGELILL